MLAAFILGIALGGLWVRRHADRVDDVVRYAGVVQVLMGCCALLSVPLLARSFDGVAWLFAALAPSTQGYALYSLATALIALAVMLPAAFFAGMTLPLFTAALLRRGAGERAIGQVYAANTLGRHPWRAGGCPRADPADRRQPEPDRGRCRRRADRRAAAARHQPQALDAGGHRAVAGRVRAAHPR